MNNMKPKHSSTDEWRRYWAQGLNCNVIYKGTIAVVDNGVQLIVRLKYGTIETGKL